MRLAKKTGVIGSLGTNNSGILCIWVNNSRFLCILTNNLRFLCMPCGWRPTTREFFAKGGCKHRRSGEFFDGVKPCLFATDKNTSFLQGPAFFVLATYSLNSITSAQLRRKQTRRVSAVSS